MLSFTSFCGYSHRVEKRVLLRGESYMTFSVARADIDWRWRMFFSMLQQPTMQTGNDDKQQCIRAEC